MARYHDSQSKMTADIEVLQNYVHDYVEQLNLERAKSEQLELIVSLQLFFSFYSLFGCLW